MNEDFVPYELAVKLKEKGFKKECLCHYIGNDLFYNTESPITNNQLWFCHNKYDNIWHRDNIDAPTISQVLKWLRKEKVISVEPYSSASGWRVTICRAYHQERTDTGGGTCLKSEVEGYNDGGAFEKYEEAALAGIEYVIDNLI